MTTLAVLGSTGSIGRQTLDVVAHAPDRFNVVALGAGRSLDLLAEQACRWRPDVVAIADPDGAAELARRVPAGTEVVAGPEALASVAHLGEVVVNGVVGFAGLGITLATLRAGHRLALANKESLIAAGPLVQQARTTPGAEIVPVDSEHCALHQCLRAGRPAEVARLVLTASGGPFRGRSRAELADVTVADALAHPTWRMGPKITVDSSTLMNKGLEVIEAHELFGGPAGPAGVGIGYDQIDVVVHPQSVVHSMVEFVDGATVAQLSQPDMRGPIGYALRYPERFPVPFGAVDWKNSSRLDFEAPDVEAFPCLALAYQAGRQGGTAPAWLNAANEVAVSAFLDGLIPWTGIADVLGEALSEHDGTEATSVDVVIDADRGAREVTRTLVERTRP